jgi:putative oxidoreductase
MTDADAIALGLLLLRSAVGVVMLAHGINHIVGGGKIAGTARWFASLGMRPGRFHAWLASITEVAAGALLIVGLLTPFAAAAVVGVMVVAWVINHRGNGFFIFRPGEGWEYVMVLAVAGAAIGALGAGEWSLDRVVGLDDWSGLSGLVIAGGGGSLGAAGLLAAFWRPEP